MSSADVARPDERDRRGAGPDTVARGLLLAAFAWGLLVVVGSVTVPLVTVGASSTTLTVTVPTQTGSASTPGPPADAGHPLPRTTILRADGATGVAVAAAPAVTALLVAGLLLPGRGSRRPASLAVAWTLSAALLLASVVGFVTFLVGLAGIPTGTLLVLACVRTAPRHGRGRSGTVPTPG